MSRLREADPWQPAKISEMMLELAAPLLDLDGGPRTAEQIRHVMHVASPVVFPHVAEEETRSIQMTKAADTMLPRGTYLDDRARPTLSRAAREALHDVEARSR